MPDHVAQPQPRDRETWPDVAKGMCIILVVLWHVVTKHYQRVDWIHTVVLWFTPGFETAHATGPLQLVDAHDHPEPICGTCS